MRCLQNVLYYWSDYRSPPGRKCKKKDAKASDQSGDCEMTVERAQRLRGVAVRILHMLLLRSVHGSNFTQHRPRPICWSILNFESPLGPPSLAHTGLLARSALTYPLRCVVPSRCLLGLYLHQPESSKWTYLITAHCIAAAILYVSISWLAGEWAGFLQSVKKEYIHSSESRENLLHLKLLTSWVEVHSSHRFVNQT